MTERPIPRTAVIIPAAGSGTRMGVKNKLLLPLAGRAVLLRTLDAFDTCPLVTAIILAVSDDTARFFDEEIRDNPAFTKVLPPVTGGATRQDSVRNALERVAGGYDLILVHDGARPLVEAVLIKAIINKARETGAAVPVVPLKDTVKVVADGAIRETPERDTLRAVQTPQGFSTDLLKRAFDEAVSCGFRGTDEASLVERLGLPVSIVPGSYENIKITTPEDLLIAESIIEKKQA